MNIEVVVAEKKKKTQSCQRAGLSGNKRDAKGSETGPEMEQHSLKEGARRLT